MIFMTKYIYEIPVHHQRLSQGSETFCFGKRIGTYVQYFQRGVRDRHREKKRQRQREREIDRERERVRERERGGGGGGER